MDTWWWLALGAVVALSLVAALVDGGARLGPRRRRRRGGVPLPHRGPRPGEIWWTREPLLVLVLAVRLESARVVRVTAERPGGARLEEPAGTRIELPPGTVAEAPGRISTLLTDDVREVALREFGHRAGEVGPDTWDQVRHLSGDG
ncbi:type II toxin-antitoxin system PemK/MazF family toxin [Streptomyces ovatisporus]|uniref:Type II toxin-antitoxin system PemK/MazF family toxin n=1 Tax=Streptomyces ovatisporus TaxID=1128682 RepID=A0ABV9AGR8_9ACTN